MTATGGLEPSVAFSLWRQSRCEWFSPHLWRSSLRQRRSWHNSSLLHHHRNNRQRNSHRRCRDLIAGAPAAVSSARTFTAPAGIILNAVRPERVADFEKLIGYLQAALATSSDATVRAQAEGWRVLKASETGPNGVALYVFLFDPTVAGADYGLGRILAAAYPDQTKLQEIWKLYTDSLATGGSLLNLTPVKVPEPQEQTK